MADHAIALDALPIYVMHGGRRPERRRRLEGELERQRIEASWVTDVNAGELSPELTNRYYRRRRWLWRRRSAATWRTRFRVLTQQEIALAISHIQLYGQLAANDRVWSLVLEDDAMLAPDFRERFDEYFASVPANADLVFIGSCCGLRIAHVEEGRHFYRKDHPATKCTDSYLIRGQAAATVLHTIVPFVLPIDWELNYHLKLHDLVVYWLEPPLVRQGSEIGLDVSSVR